MTALVQDLSATLISSAVDAACGHCGTSLPADTAQRFCCRGCETAYSIIRGLGFEEFYRRRVWDVSARALRPSEEASVDYSSYVATDGAGCSTLHLVIDGLTCAACVWLIESVLAREPQVEDCRANLTTRRATLRWRGAPADAARYVRVVTSLGFRAIPCDPTLVANSRKSAEHELLRSMAVAGFAAGNIMLLSVSVWAGHAEGMGPATRDLMHWVSALIALPAIAYAGRPFFRSALAVLAARHTNMDVPISIGVLLAAAMSLFETATSGTHAYFDSAITLLFFLLVGRYLDIRARGRARSALEHLLSLGAMPVTVVLPDGSTEMRSPNNVRVGEIVLVTAGNRIPLDGCVASGCSDLDTSIVTGETIPAPVEAGTSVFAGMVNLTSPLHITVTATGDRTLLAEIVRLVEAAEHGRARFTALADRVAKRYAPVVHVLAAATFAGWLAAGIGWQSALLNAVSVLIITCPCALALAVPVVQVIASGRLMRGGVLLKSATALERLAQADMVVFDKTGTLTLGRPELRPDPSHSPDALRLAASIAQASRHPLAWALVRACPGAPTVPGVMEFAGRGLSLRVEHEEIRLGSRAFCGVADTGGEAAAGPELWFARPGRLPMRFEFADALRPDALETVAALKAAGLNVELLSGDRAPVVSAVAKALGIATWRAECEPAAKCARLEQLRASGKRPLMVGDGLNDAPALAAAHVSISPSSAADVSQNAADAVFQGDCLAPVVEILEVARRRESLVRQNLGLALLYNVAAVPLAIAGYVTPLVAAIAMSSSSLLVIGNALRLARRKVAA